VDDDLLVLSTGRGRRALGAAVLASSTTMLDATIANVALPAIGRDFDVGVGGLQWVITSYLLTLASCILLGGAAGDRWGRRRVFVTGSGVFAVASVACGLAPSIEVLVAARLLQGVGAALIAPSSLALLQSAFVPDDRARAVGAWSGLGGLAGAVGPFLGGWLVDGPGWRWAFLLNLPVLAVAVVLARDVPESEPEAGGRFDLPGAALAIACLGPLTWGLAEGPGRGWTDPAVALALALSASAGVAFVVRQRRATTPLVPPRLFGSRDFTVLNLLTFLLYAALGAVFFLLVLQLQVSAGWSGVAAGSALIPATLLMLVGSARSGALAARIGPRAQLVVGPVLVGVALVLLSGVGPDATWWPDVLPGSILFGLGLVTFVAPLTSSVMGSVDEHLVSTGSGVNNAVARTAGLVAVALVPAVAGVTSAVGPEETTEAFSRAMLILAGLAGASAVVAAVGLPRPATCRSARRYGCAVDGAPLQPDPTECAEASR
jgi:EmrB/QacA subfamily drug resistance transporter